MWLRLFIAAIIIPGIVLWLTWEKPKPFMEMPKPFWNQLSRENKTALTAQIAYYYGTKNACENVSVRAYEAGKRVELVPYCY